MLCCIPLSILHLLTCGHESTCARTMQCEIVLTCSQTTATLLTEHQLTRCVENCAIDRVPLASCSSTVLVKTLLHRRNMNKAVCSQQSRLNSKCLDNETHLLTATQAHCFYVNRHWLFLQGSAGDPHGKVATHTHQVLQVRCSYRWRVCIRIVSENEWVNCCDSRVLQS